MALSVVLAASAGVASATTITYNLIGVTTSAGKVTGTVSINSATDLVTAADITFDDSSIGDPLFTSIGSPATYNELGQDYISGTSDSPLNYGGQIALYYDTANIGDGGDLGICLASGACGTESGESTYIEAYFSGGSESFIVTGGSLVPVKIPPVKGVAPEPSSLILLGTGILGLAALMARLSRRA